MDAKAKLGADDALSLVESVSHLIAAKGKKVVRFDMKRDAPDQDTLLSHMLGPTGNLRAPTLRRSKTLIVGFDEDVYRELL